MARAVSIANLYSKKFDSIEFEGNWLEVFGTPEKSGHWLIYGREKNGKTWVALTLADLLSGFARTWYISGEEGTGQTFQENALRAGLSPKNKNLKVFEYLPIEELKEMLQKRRSAKIVVIDNTTIYQDELKYGGFHKLRKEFPNTLFIWVAHEERNEPYGATSKLIKKMASIIMRIEGLTCFVTGRCPGGSFPIHEEKANLYHGT